MASKILTPTEVLDDEVVCYLARRYKCTAHDIISRFLQQERLENGNLADETHQQLLEENEMEILRDLNFYSKDLNIP